VDHLVEGFADTNGMKGVLTPLRIGVGGDPNNSLHEHSFVAKIAGHPSRSQLHELQQRIDSLQLRLTHLHSKVQDAFSGCLEIGLASETLRQRQLLQSQSVNLPLGVYSS
jgi:hypothetical protein